ncbi:helix-turn-helix domain-containing protein [Huintestinicola sp.]|uniref:helix-turn-helix domain-containing protein n=1 Tax=Huintestinicola sp. TaxID=2981661 RepID=UPI003D7C7387
MAFGDKLAELLEENGISQRDFASALNIAPTTLNGYIKNRRQPDFELVKKAAFILGVTTDCLLEYNFGAELTVKELSLITKLRKLNKCQQEIIYDLVDLTIKKSE